MILRNALVFVLDLFVAIAIALVMIAVNRKPGTYYFLNMNNPKMGRF
jgi:hypothetical protein